MNLWIALLILLIPAFFFLTLTGKAKGVLGVILRIPLYAFIVAILLGYIYLYGQQVATNVNLGFNINFGTLDFDDIKGFVNSKIFATILMIVTWIFVLVKTMVVTFTYIIRKESDKRITKLVSAMFVVFDVVVVPDIIVLMGTNSLFVAPLLLNLLGTGLALMKLVFSFVSKPERKVEFGY